MSTMQFSVDRQGVALLEDPIVNKGTAFYAEKRRALGLDGLLPPAIETLEQQAPRAYEAISRYGDDLARHIYLRALQDVNEVLFCRLVVDHVDETLPIVYTPTVGLACQQFSHIYRRSRCLFSPTRTATGWRRSFATDPVARSTRSWSPMGSGSSVSAIRVPADWGSRSASSRSRARSAASTRHDGADRARCRHQQPRAARRPRVHRLAARADRRRGLLRVDRAASWRRSSRSCRGRSCSGRTSRPARPPDPRALPRPRRSRLTTTSREPPPPSSARSRAPSEPADRDHATPRAGHCRRAAAGRLRVPESRGDYEFGTYSPRRAMRCARLCLQGAPVAFGEAPGAGHWADNRSVWLASASRFARPRVGAY